LDQTGSTLKKGIRAIEKMRVVFSQLPDAGEATTEMGMLLDTMNDAVVRADDTLKVEKLRREVFADDYLLTNKSTDINMLLTTRCRGMVNSFQYLPNPLPALVVDARCLGAAVASICNACIELCGQNARRNLRAAHIHGSAVDNEAKTNSFMANNGPQLLICVTSTAGPEDHHAALVRMANPLDIFSSNFVLGNGEHAKSALIAARFIRALGGSVDCHVDRTAFSINMACPATLADTGTTETAPTIRDALQFIMGGFDHDSPMPMPSTRVASARSEHSGGGSSVVSGGVDGMNIVDGMSLDSFSPSSVSLNSGKPQSKTGSGISVASSGNAKRDGSTNGSTNSGDGSNFDERMKQLDPHVECHVNRCRAVVDSLRDAKAASAPASDLAGLIDAAKSDMATLKKLASTLDLRKELAALLGCSQELCDVLDAHVKLGDTSRLGGGGADQEGKDGDRGLWDTDLTYLDRLVQKQGRELKFLRRGGSFLKGT
jgi:hypothetical protein